MLTGGTEGPIEVFDSGAAFLERARPFLEQREAANGALIYPAQDAAPSVGAAEQQPFFALASDHGAPVLAAVFVPGRYLLLSDSPAAPHRALDAIVESLLHSWRRPSGVLGPVGLSSAFAERWARATGIEARPGDDMLVRELTAVVASASPPGAFRRAEERDGELLTRWRCAFAEEAVRRTEDPAAATDRIVAATQNERLFVWDDGGVVSMAEALRPTRHGMAIGGVYTPRALRKHGYATACVARLSQRILDAGKRFCCLYTDASNPASNSIYEKMGYKTVCAVNSYRFG